MRFLFLIIIISLIIFTDRILFPKGARNAWRLMTITYLAGTTLLFEERLVSEIADFFNIGRPIDMFIYVGFLVLIRDFFLNRFRIRAINTQLTNLGRAYALQFPVANLKGSDINN